MSAELEEITTMNPVSEIEVFKAQLTQSLELTEKLITDLETREKELEVFTKVRQSLEATIAVKDKEIEQLKNILQNIETERFSNRINAIAESWMNKYNLGPENRPEVLDMLTTFQKEDDLARVEKLLGLSSPKEQSIIVPLTKTSNELSTVEQFSSVPVVELSREDRLKQLWKLYEVSNKNNNP